MKTKLNMGTPLNNKKKTFSVSCVQRIRNRVRGLRSTTLQIYAFQFFKFVGCCWCFYVCCCCSHFFVFYCLAQLRKREISTEIYEYYAVCNVTNRFRAIYTRAQQWASQQRLAAAKWTVVHETISTAVRSAPAIRLMPSPCYATRSHRLVCVCVLCVYFECEVYEHTVRTTLHHIFLFHNSFSKHRHSYTRTHST